MSEDVKFIGAEQYAGGEVESVTFKDIVMSQLKKISSNANVEFLGGYWNSKAIPQVGGSDRIVEEYVPDTREIYCNSIDFLHDITLPYFDKDMNKASEDYIKEIESKLKGYKADGVFTDKEKLSFRQDRLTLCRTLFQAMSKFLKREDYFKGKTFEEEV